MKYLKRFNEGNITPELTTEMVAELRDFCRDHLAYLTDEGFTVQVIPLFNGTSCDIVFFKQEMHSYGYGSDVAVKWSSIKDRFIPFLYMLNKEYNIIDAPANERMFLTIQPGDISDIISEKRLHSNTTIRRMRVRVEFKDQSITESVTQDDIELCCVDLFDDGFELVSFEEDTFLSSDNINSKVVMRKIISSNFDFDQYDFTSVVNQHLDKYKDRSITISGRNFDQVSNNYIGSHNYEAFTTEEQELIHKVTDVAILLSHFSKTRKAANRVNISITNRGVQNPMNFQYERYQTQIEITFYL